MEDFRLIRRYRVKIGGKREGWEKEGKRKRREKRQERGVEGGMNKEEHCVQARSGQTSLLNYHWVLDKGKNRDNE